MRLRPEVRVQVAATRFRVPDVTVLDRDQPIEQIVTRPPLEDSWQRVKRKLQDYSAMGIPEVWVIDPQDATYYRYEERQLLRKDSFHYAARGIVFDMNQIKDQLD